MFSRTDFLLDRGNAHDRENALRRVNALGRANELGRANVLECADVLSIEFLMVCAQRVAMLARLLALHSAVR